MEKRKSNLVRIVLVVLVAVAIIVTLAVIFINTDKEVSGWQGGKPNAPVLSEGMIPIKYDGEKWIATTESDSEWYNYIDSKKENATTSDSKEGQEYRKWANVMLQDGTKKEFSIGTTYEESELGSMFVWIPRYSYKITKGLHGEGLEYVGDVTTQAGLIAIKWSDGLRDNTNGDYKVPLGFTFGDNELEGFWMAKFETSKMDATFDSAGESFDLKVVPAVKPYRDVTISKLFTDTRNMEKSNIYGWKAQTGDLAETGIITGDDNNFDIHPIKRTEWGTVAYLAHAVGKTGKIWINPYSTYVTGQAGDKVDADPTTDTYNYNSQNGIHASTTDNVYGVYDMTGGAWEYMMANQNGQIAQSGFNIFPDLRYYDSYEKYDDGKIYGDALYEVSLKDTGDSSWYGEYSAYFHTNGYWLLIGGSQNRGTLAGTFSFNHYQGQEDSDSGFRIIISVK